MNTEETIKENLENWAKHLEEDPHVLESTLTAWDVRHWALFAYLEFNPDYIWDINKISRSDFDDEVTIDGNRWFWVLDDYDADDVKEESIKNLVDDMMYRDARWLIPYIDFERLDADIDRGEQLASYDGRENCFNIDDEDIYIYRTN